VTPEEIKSSISIRQHVDVNGDTTFTGTLEIRADLMVSRHAYKSEKHVEEIENIIRAKILGAIFSDRRKELMGALREYSQYHFAVGDPAKVAQSQDKLLAFVNYL
jgi:hypothetical protein